MRLDEQIKRIEIIEVPEQFYFKVSAAGKYIGLSAKTLRKYSDLGLIKVKRLPISGDRIYRKDQLDEFMENLPDAIDSFTGSAYNHPQSDLSSNPKEGGYEWELEKIEDGSFVMCVGRMEVAPYEFVATALRPTSFMISSRVK